MPNKSLQKRIRIFAGPNGSGKSTLYSKIKQEYSLRFGYYINADNIYETLKKTGFIDGNEYGIKASLVKFHKFFDESGWDKYAKEKNYIKKWKVNDNIISVNKKKLRLYDPAILSDFARNQLMLKGETFTFETVMSHPSKIDFIKQASLKKYKVYLYFIATEDPDINLNRVKIRVDKGGHNIPEGKISSRYLNTLNLLLNAMELCYRSYIFDNTNEIKLIASVDDKSKMQIEDSFVPNWFRKYVVDKIKK